MGLQEYKLIKCTHDLHPKKPDTVININLQILSVGTRFLYFITPCKMSVESTGHFQSTYYMYQNFSFTLFKLFLLFYSYELYSDSVNNYYLN